MKYFLIAVLGILLVGAPSRADEISQVIDVVRVQEPRLTQRVTVWRPIIQVGDLLEQAAKQTGVPVFADDSDGAAGVLVLAYFRDLPLDQLMEALPSLLSEKGALWTWRILDGPNGKRYRLSRSRRADELQERLRKPLREKYLAALEKALSGRIGNDPAAALLAKISPSALDHLRDTTYEIRHDLVFGAEDGEEFAADGFTLNWGRWLPYFTVIDDTGEDRELRLEPDSDTLKQIQNEVSERWKLTGDSSLARLLSAETAVAEHSRAAEMDPLARIALKTGVPVLAYGSLHITQQLSPKAESWKELVDSPGYIAKVRGKVALLRHPSPNSDSQDKLHLSWATVRTLRIKISQERNKTDSLATLCWFLSQLPDTRALQWYGDAHTALTPYELPVSLRFTTVTLSSMGMFSAPTLTPLLAACGQSPAVFDRACTEQGIGAGDSAELLTTFRDFTLGYSGVIFSASGDKRSLRFRFGIKPMVGVPEVRRLDAVDFSQGLEEYRVGRNKPDWQSVVRLELQLENGSWFETARIVVSSSCLKFLPPPGAENASVTLR